MVSSESNMQIDKDEMLSRMREILGDKFVELTVEGYRLDESFETNTATVSCPIYINGGPETVEVSGRGSGVVDAFFQGLREGFGQEYRSLNSIEFHDFTVKGMMATRTVAAGSDAEALVELTVLSSEGVAFSFTTTSRSITRAAMGATLQAVGYFVNSEKTFIEIYNILKHYRSEGRIDLVTKYQRLLTEMVRNTSYTEVIAQITDSELQRRG